MKTQKEAEASLNTAEIVSRALGMALRESKCGVIHVRGGKVVKEWHSNEAD